MLIGRTMQHSKPLKTEVFDQKRISCFFSKGKAFYLEYNMRLFFFLLFTSADCYCAIDLDTILPNYFASALKRKHRVYDAHELFTEQKEIVTRPAVHKMWLAIERFAVPKFQHGYTVNSFIADEFKSRYKVNYEVVRNLPVYKVVNAKPDPNNPFIIYQGAVNEGRSFETLIPAMQHVAAKLVICGNGNFFEQVKELIKLYDLGEKVVLKGMVEPEELKRLTPTAFAAIMIFEGTGLNQYQSLANRFFDYVMAGVPQVCVNYPQYKFLNDQYEVASLIPDTKEETIAAALNNLLSDNVYYSRLQKNCLHARTVLNWQQEEAVLVEFYKALL